MCGIVGYIGEKDITSILIVGLAYVWVKGDLDWVKRRVRYASGRYEKIAIKSEN